MDGFEVPEVLKVLWRFSRGSLEVLEVL